MDSTSSATRARVSTYESFPIVDGWMAARDSPDQCPGPTGLDALEWLPAQVPGTAAGVLRDAGAWDLDEPHDFDSEDWCFRVTFPARVPTPGEELVLHFDGLATVAEVFLNGERILFSNSMFQTHAVDVGGLLRESNDLAIRFAALGPLLKPRRRPRARWRTRLVAEGNLRFFRTMLLGRAPGFAPGPSAVGPWREVRLERRHVVALDALVLRSRLSGREGTISIQASLRALDDISQIEAAEVELSGPSGRHTGALALKRGEGDVVQLEGELRIADVACWWPHTHGEPSLYEARLLVHTASASIVVQAGSVGFRDLRFGAGADHDVSEEGLDLHVNGVRVFLRGAVWTPIDTVCMAPDRQQLRQALQQVRQAGMNMLRVVGTGAYESEAFHDLCDELGILLWQDFMFANLDYPIADDEFRRQVEREITQVLDALCHRPSLTVFCGNSEIEQQVAMLGLDPALGRGELFGELIPKLIERSGTDAVYVPSTPCGGEHPFRPAAGIANYYGVGGYRRPLEDLKSAGVRFAAECLAFSNVPDQQALEEMFPDAPASLVAHHPRWKEGVPCDVGAGWDFEDVRDHYFQLLFGMDPVKVRSFEHERYLELSRLLSGEVMAETFGEWRRASSVCGGGMVLWLRDLKPGAGWGLLDQTGRPKVAYHYLRRALLPVAVWITDEGLGGATVHLANDRSEPFEGHLRVSLYSDFEHRVNEIRKPVMLAPHDLQEHDIETLLGRFVDLTWAYRFGPPTQNLIVASLETETAATQTISSAVRFPIGYPLLPESAERLGMTATASVLSDGRMSLSLASRRLAWGVRLDVPGFQAEDDAFSLEPGLTRVMMLHPTTAPSGASPGHLSAANMRGRVKITLQKSA